MRSAPSVSAAPITATAFPLAQGNRLSPWRRTQSDAARGRGARRPVTGRRAAAPAAERFPTTSSASSSSSGGRMPGRRRAACNPYRHLGAYEIPLVGSMEQWGAWVLHLATDKNWIGRRDIIRLISLWYAGHGMQRPPL
jgi:hypothetical protein